MKRMFKIFVFAVSFQLIAISFFGQPGKFQQTSNRDKQNGIILDTFLAPPIDTFRTNVNTTAYKNFPWLGVKSNKLFLWNTSSYRFTSVGIDSIYVHTGTDSVFARLYGTETFMYLKTAGAGVYVDTVYARNDTLLYKKNGVEFSVVKITNTETVQDAVGAMINASLQYVDATPLLAINDRNFGDLTTSGAGLIWQINQQAVTYDKIQNISATNVVLGRITGGGSIEELTGTAVTTILDVFTSTLKGIVPASGGGTTNFLRADGTWSPFPAVGVNNLNTGSGFRLLKPGTQEIKTLFNGYAVLMDSTTNGNGITFKIDTSLIATVHDVSVAANIFNSDGTLTGDRTLSMANHFLEFDNGAFEHFLIDPVTGRYFFGDISGQNNSTALVIVDSATVTPRWRMTNIQQQTQGNVLYYDPITGKVSYNDAINIYNSNGILTFDRTLTGLNNTYGLVFDSINVFAVRRNNIDRIFMNSAFTYILSSNGLSSVSAGNGILSMNAISNTNYFNVNSDSSFTPKRISYTGNIHGTFTQFSVIDKKYCDSVASAAGTNIYNSNGSLTGNRIVTTDGFNLDFINNAPTGHRIRFNMISSTRDAMMQVQDGIFQALVYDVPNYNIHTEIYSDYQQIDIRALNNNTIKDTRMSVTADSIFYTISSAMGGEGLYITMKKLPHKSSMLSNDSLLITDGNGRIQKINKADLGVSGTPGGSSGQFQYNNGGAFGGTAGVTYATSGTHVTITSQATTDVQLLLQGVSSQTADYFQVKNSGGSTLMKFTTNGELLTNGASDHGNFDVQVTRGIYVESVASNNTLIEGYATSGGSNSFIVQNSGGSTWLVFAGGAMDLALGTGNSHIVSFQPGFTGMANASATGFYMGSGTTAASAYVHIKAGTATAGTAPLKFTSGTALSSTEDGAMEYHSSHLYFTIGSTRYQLDQQCASLKVNTTDVGNVGAGEDDLMTYSVPGGTLANANDYLEFSFTIKFAANANNKQVKLYYGGTNFYASGAQAQNDGTMEIVGKIIRTGATSQRITYSVSTNANLFTDYADYTTAAETLSGAVTLKATGEATSDNDIISKILTVKYFPGN